MFLETPKSALSVEPLLVALRSTIAARIQDLLGPCALWHINLPFTVRDRLRYPRETE